MGSFNNGNGGYKGIQSTSIHFIHDTTAPPSQNTNRVYLYFPLEFIFFDLFSPHNLWVPHRVIPTPKLRKSISSKSLHLPSNTNNVPRGNESISAEVADEIFHTIIVAMHGSGSLRLLFGFPLLGDRTKKIMFPLLNGPDHASRCLSVGPSASLYINQASALGEWVGSEGLAERAGPSIKMSKRRTIQQSWQLDPAHWQMVSLDVWART